MMVMITNAGRNS